MTSQLPPRPTTRLVLPRKPMVCLVGGPDVDARKPLMEQLKGEFELCAVGTDRRLAASFASNGLRYRSYDMTRGVNPLRDLRAVWQLIRIFRAEHPDLVHTFDTKPAIWGRLAARLAGVPVVIGTLPGLGSLYAARSRKAKVVRLAYQPLQMIACRLSDLTTFQNEDDAREFARRRVVPRARALVITGSGIPTDVFAPINPESARLARQEHRLQDEIAVVMVSRVVRSKGVLEFAAAARMARTKNPAVRFILVGPEDRTSLDALTRTELDALRGSVTWLGPRSQVREILGMADIFVFPSFYREGIPRALLEAASMGLPLIAADVPGSREVVADGVNGYLVPPRDPDAIVDAVLLLADSPDLRVRFGDESRKRAVLRFDLAAVAARTASVYHELLAVKLAS